MVGPDDILKREAGQLVLFILPTTTTTTTTSLAHQHADTLRPTVILGHRALGSRGNLIGFMPHRQHRMLQRAVLLLPRWPEHPNHQHALLLRRQYPVSPVRWCVVDWS